MNASETRSWLEYLASLMPAVAPSIDDTLVLRWSNTLALVPEDEARALVLELVVEQQWPSPARVSELRRVRRERAAKDDALRAARAAIANVPIPNDGLTHHDSRRAR